ncbi:MAG: L-threonine 3-dehydrogenase [Planctomycetota bacterium]|nr:L-threonine 3-dehydrogenase [Planctomycetota bacterium]
MMKALVKKAPEPGLDLIEKPIPPLTADGVRIRVLATSICGTDLHIYNWDPWAASKVAAPLTVGHEFCGEVMEVGEKVSRFQAGDYVAAESHVFCDHCRPCRSGQRHICENEKIIGVQRDGAFAEQIVMPDRCIWRTSTDLPPDIATLQEPLGNSVHATLAGEVSRRHVMVTGCGPTGLFAVAIAKTCGAASVMAVDVQDYRLDLASKLGADLVLNPLQCDVVPKIHEATEGRGADVVLEMSGNEKAIEDGLRSLSRGGDFRFFGVPSDRISVDVARDIIFKGARVQGILGRKVWDTWHDTARLLEAGLDLNPIVTHRLAIEDYQIAFDLIQKGECGKVILYPDGIPDRTS